MTKILGMLAMLFLAGLCAGCSTTPAGGRTVTVMSYNIHHGEGTDGKLDLERIAKIIRSHNPDLVALQEVDEKTQRTQGTAQAAELGRMTGMYHVFGKAMDYSGGGYGQAILARWPIKEHQVHQLPQRDGREPRIVLVATIDAPGENFVFASTHLDHQVEEIRLQQAAAINKVLATGSRATPMLLAGDFNAVPESGTVKALLGTWDDTAGNFASPTIPSGKPTRRIDYIFATPRSIWETVCSEVLDEPVASDHRPVVAILKYTQ